MKKYLNFDIITTGLAAFSMFFGAGNVVYPLIIGKIAGTGSLLALTGLLITAVGIPFLGLIAMSYFDGNYEAFFHRIGKIPGSLFIGIIMALIGPLAATPRLITVAHAAIKMYIPQLSLFHFSILSALIVYAFTVKKSTILDALGNILSPILLISLGIIITKGLWFTSPSVAAIQTNGNMFSEGLLFGYNTMDLFASIFFSSVILSLMKIKMAEKNLEVTDHHLAINTLKSGAIATTLLGIIYLGLGLVSSIFSGELINVGDKEILSIIADKLLGPTGGIIAGIAVAMACLTTAITLATVFADFLSNEAFPGKINYKISLIITLATTTLFANLGFEGIMTLLEPALGIVYPAVITLTIFNILYKTIGIKTVKIPVFLTLAIALAFQCNTLKNKTFTIKSSKSESF